jgi:hypothetical protein
MMVDYLLVVSNNQFRGRDFSFSAKHCYQFVGINKIMNINSQMSSSEEPIRCNECGQEFDTIGSLKEHREVERQEKELRSKGIDR